ncbi:helix-turn-helix domain-containing protein [Sporolactobacillus pectinivorans]|uniref:helix-turn-helix domain-containing protein n=1 Tax=Sporolactobacillus pectinivorans TaxID=1591408 RepID=UPI000C2561AC|nr:helix-turn-helix transcriptional regulator [Sporolactobacillus pectinivorans]
MLTVDLKKMKKLRKKQMSLEQMSSKLGYGSPNGYYYLETGHSKISAEMLAKVAMILKVPITDFFVDDRNSQDD